MSLKRIPILDFIRSIAIMSVIALHVIDALFVNRFLLSNPSSWVIYSFFHNLFRSIGVPFFLMLTGSLLLSQDYLLKIPTFYLNRIPKLVLKTIFYYLLILIIFELSGHDLSFSYSNFSFQGAYHMWYMPIIIGIYLLLPYVKILISGLTLKELLTFVLLMGLIQFIPTWLGFFSIEIEPLFLLNSFPTYYLIYVVLGYLIFCKGVFKSVRLLHLIWIFLITMILMLLHQFALIVNEKDIYISWYNSPYIIVSSIVLFLLLQKVPQFFFTPTLWEKISVNTFRIYLFHIIPLDLFLTYFNENFKLSLVNTIFLFFLTFCSSFLYSWIIKKTPVLSDLA